jgi:pimeloyl-ACP methyl ester carboxylesterase
MNEPATKHLQLADGRNLSYSDTGTGENGTWIHCHGIPGSRNELLHLDETLGTSGLRMIVPDRPGYGGSSPVEDYDFVAHTKDLAALADYLGVKRFSLSGFSGGGIFAMAAANDMADRIDQLVIAGTPAAPMMESPLEHVSELTAGAWLAAKDSPEPLAAMLQNLTASYQSLADAMINAADDQERAYLQGERTLPGILGSMQAAVAQGAAISANAMARDTFLIIHPWPFMPESINVPSRLIHGRQDAIVHPAHLHVLLEGMPGANGDCIDGAGHYSVLPFAWT